MKIHQLPELNVLERWQKNRTYESMRALVGQKAGGANCYLNIHEKYHGPHGLVAGTTGAGKSETLQTYILALAANFSPMDVGFFIIAAWPTCSSACPICWGRFPICPAT